MKEKIRTVLFWFILLQPFLDLYWFYNGQLAKVLPFTLPTIIRIAAVFVIFCMFFSQKQNWQKLGQDKWLIAYLILLALYSLLHLWHVQHFVSVSPNDYGYSNASELFYLIRMALPLLVLYFTKEISFTKRQLRQVVLGLASLFSFTIVLSNLFCLSLRAYGRGHIWANIFMWFSGQNWGYSHLASKGFFNFSNMVSAVLFALLPLVFYYLMTSFNWQTVLVTSVQALAMIELGTKVGAIGLIGGILVGLALYLLHHFLFKNARANKKAVWTAIIIEIAALALLPFGPAVQRYNYEKYLAAQSDHDLSAEKRQLTAGLAKYPRGKKRKTFLRAFIKENYHAYALNKKFVFKSYPYQRDPEFWLGIMRENGEQRMQNRHLEQAMLNRVVAKNNNRLDPIFGISYTRQSHIFNLERDFASQIYSLGWLGMLLFLGPYLALLLFAAFEWIRKKQARTYLISSLLLSTFFMLAAAFASGNVMDFLTASFILAFIEGNLLVQIISAA